MTRQRHQRRAIVGVEILLGVTVLIVLAIFVAEAVFGYHRTQDQYTWRQAAVLAAEAQLQRLRAGAPAESRPPDGMLADGIELCTDVEPGDGAWEDFNRVTVTASASIPSGGRVAEKVSGYVRKEVRP